MEVRGFFPGFFSFSVVGGCKEDYKPDHCECQGYYPQTKKSRLTELSEYELIGLGWNMSQTEVL